MYRVLLRIFEQLRSGERVAVFLRIACHLPANGTPDQQLDGCRTTLPDVPLRWERTRQNKFRIDGRKGGLFGRCRRRSFRFRIFLGGKFRCGDFEGFSVDGCFRFGYGERSRRRYLQIKRPHCQCGFFAVDVATFPRYPRKSQLNAVRRFKRRKRIIVLYVRIGNNRKTRRFSDNDGIRLDIRHEMNSRDIRSEQRRGCEQKRKTERFSHITNRVSRDLCRPTADLKTTEATSFQLSLRD